jgi:ligand-binding sensor domain-containing protein
LAKFKPTNKLSFFWQVVLSLAITCSLQGPCLLAQPVPPGLRHFTANDGLPSSEVYEVLQDKQGYLWFSTDNGVCRYNGYEFEKFGALQGLQESVIFNMQEGPDGRIWMQGMSGRLYFWDGAAFRPFEGNRFLPKEKTGEAGIVDFYVDEKGGVYISEMPLGLVHFEEDGRKQHHLVKDKLRSSVFVAGKKALVVNCGNVKPLESGAFDLLDGQVTPFKVPPGYAYLKAYRLRGGTLLVFKNNQVLAIKNRQVVWQSQLPGTVIAYLEQGDGSLYIGLHERKGVLRFPTLDALREGRGQAVFSGYSVSHILADREDGHWFTTTEAGVFYQPNPSLRVYNQASGLPLESVSSLALLNGPEICLGFDGSGVVKLDFVKNRVTPLQLPYSRVYDLYFDKQNQALWVAAFPYIQVLRNGRWEMPLDALASASQSKPVGFPARRFHAIPSDTSIWVALHDGFSKIKLDGKWPIAHLRDREILGDYHHTRTYDAYTSKAGRSFVCNFNGMFEIKGKALVPCPPLHPAFGGRVEALAELPDSTLVLGTKGYGLVFWKGDRIGTLTEADGLAADMVENLHLDKSGQLWAGTLNGLSRVRWSWEGAAQVRNITTAHGLPSNEIADVATDDQALWVATTGGLAYFEQVFDKVATAQKPILERVWVNEQEISLVGAANLPLQLKSGDRNIRIKFVSLQYANTGGIQYRYRLHPTSPWTLTNDRTLNLASLAAGSYELEVQAQNANHDWSSSTELRFQIPLYWWQRWWFVTLATLLLASLVVGVFRYRELQRNKEKELRQQLVSLEYSALQAQMNPHFIFNCLNSIQNFILLNDKDAAIEYLNKFARLVRGILNASVKGKIALDDEVKLLEDYLLLEQLRFDNSFSFSVKIHPELDTLGLKIPPMLIQPYVENAVLHGLSNKQQDGHVSVFFEEKDQHLMVTVRDNGKGMPPPSDGPKTPLHKSVGMSITGRRLELLTNLPANQTVKVDTALNEQGDISGTVITILIKPA